MTTPTVNETDSTNMPGVYELLLDEDMTIGSGNDTEEMAFHITATGMDAVTRTIELYRSKITAGNTLDVTATGAAGIDWGNIENKTTANDLSGTDIQLCDTVTTLTGHTAQTGDTYALANGAAGFVAIDTVVDGIQTDLSNGTDGLGAIKTVADAIETDTQDIQSRLPAALVNSRMDATIDATGFEDAAVDKIWDEALSGHNTGGTTGKALRNAGGLILHTGTSDNTPTNTSTTISLESGAASSVDDYYNHTVVIITGGTGAGQERIIADYTGSNASAVVTPAWITTPDATSEYEIVPGTVHAETQGGGYQSGAVWVAATGSTGTQLYVDGTIDNPIADSSFANAKTVADALNLKVFHIGAGSSITLAAAYDDYEFTGVDYTVALGGQSISGTTFHNATITGNDDGSNTTNPVFDHCNMGENTLGQHTLQECRMAGTTAGITLAEAGNYFWEGCFSGVAGTGTPKITFAAGNMNVNLRHWSGGIQIEAMGASASTDTMSIEGWGQVIEGTCTGGTVAIRGNFTTSGITNLTLSDDARIDVAAINAEVDTAWTTQMADSTVADDQVPD
jgi:hypothetical protein